jgi:putative FmdB family regulatory protein
VPIYEYRCDNSHEFDVFQRMSDDPLTECQVCGAPARRVLSAPAVHFKGSGFYSTDYGKKKKSSETSTADTKPKKSESSSDSSSSSNGSSSSSDD